MTPKDEVTFNVLRNALYHTSRRLTFERWNRWCSFAVILLGAAAVSDMGRLLGAPWYATVTGLLVAVFGSIQLVFDFGGKARDHQSLQRDYYALLADIVESHGDDDAKVAGWNAKMTRIAADEPPTMRALDAKAYNDTLSGTGMCSEEDRIYIPPHHRLFGQFWAFEGYPYRRFSELRRATTTAAKGAIASDPDV